MSRLPIIDFSPFLDPASTIEAKRASALQIDQACREVGFFYLSNHGVDFALMEAMVRNARIFFKTATQNEKDTIAWKKAGDGDGDGARGWQKSGGGARGAHELVDMFRPVDSNKAPPFDVGYGQNKWPLTPKDFRETSEEYIKSVTSLGTNVIKAIALGLDVDEALFTSRIDECFWNLRIIGYEAMNSTNGSFKEAGIGEHTDFGILTFLLSDSQRDSLQVLAKTGEWIPANPIPGCFLCNIGDMLAEWTGGLYVSTLHRVRHNSDKMRISIPLFFDPNMDALISPVLPLDRKSRPGDGVLYREAFVKAMKEYGAY